MDKYKRNALRTFIADSLEWRRPVHAVTHSSDALIHLRDFDEGERYFPLRDTPEVFFDYIALSEPAAVFNFASRYGNLGLWQENPKRQNVFSEPVSEWLRDAEQLRLLFTIVRDALTLRGLVRSRIDTAAACTTARRRLNSLLDTSVSPDVFAKWRGGGMASIPSGIRKSRAQTDQLIYAALAVVAADVANEVRGSLSVHCEVIPGSLLRTKIAPITLRTALWVRLAEFAEGSRLIAECEVCGNDMDVTGNRRHKRVHDRCGRNERQRQFRRRRSAKEESE